MGSNEVDREAYLLMFASPHHAIFIYIFILAVFMLFWRLIQTNFAGRFLCLQKVWVTAKMVREAYCYYALCKLQCRA